jgi:hypothetical protein
MYTLDVKTPDVVTFMGVLRCLMENDLVTVNILTTDFMKKYINFDSSNQLQMTGIKSVSCNVGTDKLDETIDILETNIPEVQYTIKENK